MYWAHESWMKDSTTHLNFQKDTVNNFIYTIVNQENQFYNYTVPFTTQL